MSSVTPLLRPLPPPAEEVTRVIAAYLIAPAPFAAFFYVTWDVSAVVLIYVWAALLGIPTYVVLRWRGWFRYWNFSAAGLLLGGIPVVSTLALEFIERAPRWHHFNGETATIFLAAFAVLAGAVQGFLVASIAWLLVRSVSQRPNPSIEGTRSGLRPPRAPHVKR